MSDNETPPSMEVSLRHAIGKIKIEADFTTAGPWTILFGPSGSGKTTILRALTGAIRAHSGRIVVRTAGQEQATSLFDSRFGINLPTHLRGLPLAPQQASLFPHYTVKQQIAFGLPPSQPADSRALARRVANLLDLLQITHLADSYPAALSGGEAQRVNLARAAACATTFLLLDEPFTGLDPALRTRLISDMRTWTERRRIAVLSVTHDVPEAHQLGAEVIKLDEGRIVLQGPASEVLAEERHQLLDQLSPPI